MKKLRFLFLLLALAAGAYGQNAPVSGPITASASSCPSNQPSTACVLLPIGQQTAQVGITVSGTFSATLQFEWTADGGNTWVALSATPNGSSSTVTSTTATGVWIANVGGASFIRVRSSAYTSGVAQVTLNPSQAAAASSGNSSGGTTHGSCAALQGAAVNNATIQLATVTGVVSCNIPAAVTVFARCVGTYTFQSTTAEALELGLVASQTPQNVTQTGVIFTAAATVDSPVQIILNSSLSSSCTASTCVKATAVISLDTSTFNWYLDGTFMWNASTAGTLTLGAATASASGTVTIPANSSSCMFTW